MTRLILLALLVAGCGTAVPPRYERVPVPSTPFTRQKLEVNEVICAEKGKTLQCAATPRGTQDCWCEPR